MAATKSTEAYSRVRRDIVSGVIPANVTIDEAELGRRYGLGRTPIREALKQLRNDQLLVWPDRRSPYVPEIGVGQVRSLYEARTMFETQTAAVAAERITDTEAESLDRLVAEEADLVARGMPYEAVEVDLQFHRGVAEATGNTFLVDASTRINVCALRIWHDMIATEEMLATEHADIVEALRRHDGDGAADAARRHIANAYERYIRMTSRIPSRTR
ncbi:GntR family transcriptional regulator [Marmoricola endophyticus]|uniref:GntR family transcriptional regulator n=1 Tax=Marmoricola endophyticus TaxID=2040280 RepID=A0A917BKQ8_9ACTN|nr:GntR family transcriptional regulator [Marmoricola endophyticus]GGF49869.1 GntR family transcriptional regulator [Marmoricola endophyticus]